MQNPLRILRKKNFKKGNAPNRETNGPPKTGTPENVICVIPCSGWEPEQGSWRLPRPRDFPLNTSGAPPVQKRNRTRKGEVEVGMEVKIKLKVKV